MAFEDLKVKARSDITFKNKFDAALKSQGLIRSLKGKTTNGTAESRASTLERLPSQLIDKIKGELPIRDLNSTRLASSRFYGDPSVYKGTLVDKGRLQLYSVDRLLDYLEAAKGNMHELDLPALFSNHILFNISNEDFAKIIKLCPNLTSLNLSGTNVQAQWFTEIAKLSELKHLTLAGVSSNDHFWTLGLSRLNQLKKLESLDLSFNPRQLGDAELRSINEITQLKSLNLSLNPTDLNLSLLNRLQLRELLLENTNVNWDQLRGMTSLQMLSVRSTNMTDEDAQKLSTLIYLRELNVADNTILGTGFVNTLSSFPNLSTLNLQNCRNISLQDFERICQLPNMTSLSVSHEHANHLEKIDSEKIQSLSLNDVPSSDNHTLTEETLNKIASCTHLNELTLNNCGLTDADFDILTGLNELQILDVSGNSLSVNARLKLALLPRLQFIKVDPMDAIGIGTFQDARKAAGLSPVRFFK
jgi:Leucine-rich repeat (LRR) protein